MKQTELVLQYIKDHKNITPAEAMRELGIYRLGARIYDLRREGLPIQSGWLEVNNRYGEKTRVKQYWLGEETK